MSGPPVPIDVLHLGHPQVISCWRIDDVLVDPGPASSVENLLAELGDWRPDRILLTHIHFDHAGAAGVLARRWPDLEVWVHERGARHLADPTKLVASATRLYGDDMERLWGEVAAIPERQLRVLRGGESADGWDVAYTPGHASHHVAYRHQRTGWAFTGDVAGCRIAPRDYIVVPTPPPDIDVEAWHASIDTLQAWEPVALGLTHFGAVTDPVEHLERLHVVLTSWAELARRLDADAFEAAAYAATAAALPLREGAALTQAMPPDHLWPGLHRYWSKREG